MRILFALLFTLSLSPVHAAKIETGDPALNQAFAVMLGRDFAAKEAALTAIAESGHPQTVAIVQGLIDGSVLLEKKSGRVVFAKKQGRNYLATDAFNGEVLGEFKKRKLKRFPVNNHLRRLGRDRLALQRLRHADPAVRLEAVETMLAHPKAEYASSNAANPCCNAPWAMLRPTPGRACCAAAPRRTGSSKGKKQDATGTPCWTSAWEWRERRVARRSSHSLNAVGRDANRRDRDAKSRQLKLGVRPSKKKPSNSIDKSVLQACIKRDSSNSRTSRTLPERRGGMP